MDCKGNSRLPDVDLGHAAAGIKASISLSPFAEYTLS